MSNQFHTQLLQGVTKQLILSVLAEEPLYGYQIVKEIYKQSGDALEFETGSIYPALHYLEKKGLLTSNWKEVDGRERKYYALTRRGKLALKKHMQEWKAFSRAVDKVVTQVQPLT